MASLGDVAEFRWKARKSATRASSEECARLRQGPRFPRADRKTARRDESRIAEASRAPMTRVQSRALRYGDSSNFVGLPRKRHKIPPIQQSRHFTGALSQASTSYDSARRTHRKNVVSNPRLINSRPNLLTDRRLQTAQASLDLRYARQPPNADWLFLVRFLKVTHALH
jgi:hypothetical protein